MKKKAKYEAPVAYDLTKAVSEEVHTATACRSGANPGATSNCQFGNNAGPKCQTGAVASGRCLIGNSPGGTSKCKAGGLATDNCSGGSIASQICKAGGMR